MLEREDHCCARCTLPFFRRQKLWLTLYRQIFFDVNPSHRRNLFHSPCAHFVRLSFGPPMAELDKGLDGIQRLVDRAKHAYAKDGHLKQTVGGYKQSEEKHKSAGRLDAGASGS